MIGVKIIRQSGRILSGCGTGGLSTILKRTTSLSVNMGEFSSTIAHESVNAITGLYISFSRRNTGKTTYVGFAYDVRKRLSERGAAVPKWDGNLPGNSICLATDYYVAGQIQAAIAKHS